MWTSFMDMHSGGDTKEKPYEYIYIELPKKEAEVYFQNRFGHNPYRVSCTCCGEDYSVNEHKSLRQATGYERGCKHLVKKSGKWDPDDPVLKRRTYYENNEKAPEGYKFVRGYGPYVSLKKYCNREDVLIIRKKEIDPKMAEGELSEQGYVWI